MPLSAVYKDLETYRSTVKKQIKDWHSTVIQKKNQEWIILQIVRPDARVAGGGFFAMKGSILDRIKADFNLDKRDRCVYYTRLGLAVLTDHLGVYSSPGRLVKTILPRGQNA